MSDTHSIHQENVKLQVRQIFLDEMIRTMTETVPGCEFRVVFNLNELGIAELEDRKTRNVIVPSPMMSRMIPHIANINPGYVLIVIEMSACRCCFTPYIVTLQNSRSPERVQSAAESELALFIKYVRMMFLSYVVRLPSLVQFAGEETIRLVAAECER
jgi:hypothetical protein